MGMMKIRNERIDVVRGLAIVLVVLEHALGYPDHCIEKIILSFHMPLFFLISGWLAKGNDGNQPVKAFLLKKLRTIVVPHITLSVISGLYTYFVSYRILGNYDIAEFNVISMLFQYWFLLVLLYVELIWYIMQKLQIITKAYLVGSFFVCIICTIVFPQNLSGPGYVLVIPTAFAFFEIGYFIKTYKLNKKMDRRIQGVLVVLFIVLALMNDTVLMYKNTYGIVFIFLMTSLLGSLLVVNFSAFIVRKSSNLKKWLIWCGQNSIVIYVLHFSIVQAVRGILIRLLHVEASYIGGVVFVVSWCLTVISALISSKYIPFLFGKSNARVDGRK